MKVELVRTVATYAIATLVIVGSGFLLRSPGQIPPEQLLPFVTGQVGAVIAFVFTERQTAAANGASSKAVIEALHRRLDAAGIPREATHG